MSSKEIEDLWPAELDLDAEEQPPFVVLRQQAELVANKTAYLVEGRVGSFPGEDGNLILRFFFVVPSMKNYRVELFLLKQPARFYPATLEFDDRVYEAASEEELKAHLRTIFASTACKRILSGLYAQAKND